MLLTWMTMTMMMMMMRVMEAMEAMVAMEVTMMRMKTEDFESMLSRHLVNRTVNEGYEPPLGELDPSSLKSQF
jgi:hypothetical protein